MKGRCGFRCLMVGLLIGGAFAVFQILQASEEFLTLPRSNQLRYAAVLWFAYALTGLVATVVFSLGRALWRRGTGSGSSAGGWAPGFALAVFACLELAPLGETVGTAGFGAIAALLTVVVLASLSWLSARIPLLESPALWAAVNLVALAGVSLAVLLAPPFDHGASWAAKLAFLATAVGPGALLLAAAAQAGRVRRIAAGVLPLLMVVTVLWPGAGGPPAGSDERGEKTNVFLITIDTLRADHLGCYGNPTVKTPHMDRLARQGVLFENAISPMPLTNPSHLSILSGVYPGNHGVTGNMPIRIPPGVSTLAERLEHDGYRTAAFVSGAPLKKSLSRLFERFQVYEDDFSPIPAFPELLLRSSLAPLLVREQDLIVGLSERSAAQTANRAVDWLDRNAGSSFFLWVHFYDPHFPYAPPPPFDRQYGNWPREGWTDLSLEKRKAVASDPRKLAYYKARYAGEVSYVDSQVGRLLDSIDRLDLNSRTLLVLAADHGENLNENGHYFGHQLSLFEPSLKVPLLFRFPTGSGAGRRIADLAALIDVAPTVFEYLDLPVPERTDGRSLMDRIRAKESPRPAPPAVSFIDRNMTAGSKNLLAIRTADHKYIFTSAWWGGKLLVPGSEELYDLGRDPGELVNVLHEDAEAAQRLRSLAESYWRDWYSQADATRQQVPERELERLRALGYVQ